MDYSWKNAGGGGSLIKENTPAGAVLATFVAQDPWAGDAFYYTLSGADAWAFSIDLYGRLYLKYDRDYEGDTWRPNRQFSVIVNAYNDAGAWQAATPFILSVANVIEAPTFQRQQQPIGYNVWSQADTPMYVNVVENNAAGMQVGKFLALDKETGGKVNYSLAGRDSSYFSIDNSGRLFLVSSLNYEDASHSKKYYGVAVKATSLDGIAVSNLFVVSLQNNSNEFAWTNNPIGLDISETAALAGASLANFDIGAVDGSNPVIEGGNDSWYWLTNGDTWAFEIDGKTGVLRLKYQLDYEGVNSWRPDHRFSVVVNAWRNGGDNISQLFVLTVADVNEAPVFQWQLQPFWGQNSAGAWNNWAAASDTRYLNIAENNAGAGSQVAKFQAVDPDIGARVTYDVVGTDAAYFSIDSNGRLYLASNLDYESAHAGKVYSVVVTAKSTDASPAITNLVVITLGNVDDNATAWNVSPTTGIAVNETTGITNTVVRPTLESLANFSAVDADGQTVKYALSGDSWMFSIDGNGVLYRTRNVDYETNQRQFSVTVWAWGAKNTGGITNEGAGIGKLFILTINNVNEFTTGFTWAQQPMWGQNSAGAWNNWAAASDTRFVNVSENNAVGVAVGQFAATDGDGVAVNYSLSGADAGYFSINNNGTLSLISRLDYESAHAKNYSVTVTATSIDGSAAVNSLFVVSLQDNTKEFGWVGNNLTGVAISETAALVGVTVADFNIAALDNGPSFVEGTGSGYWLADRVADNWAFNINQQTGVLKLVFERDYESEHSWRPDHRFTAVVGAWRDGGGTMTQVFVLTVADVNEAPAFQWQPQPLWGQDSKGGWNNWAAASDTRYLNITENNIVGLQVAKFQAVDPDIGARVTYSLGGADAAYFTINANGALSLKSSLNYEDSNHADKVYSVVVNAKSTDGGSDFASNLVVITLNNDPNEFGWINRPRGIILSETATLPGTVIADFNIGPQDNSDPFVEGINSGYWLTGGDASLFNINSYGRLSLKQTIDYDTTGVWWQDRDRQWHNPDHRYSVVVNAWNGSAPTVNQVFIITVTNVNDNPTNFAWAQQPLGVNQWRNAANGPISVNVNENNAIGMAVGQFAATDGDWAMVTYSLSGADAGYFNINNNGTVTLISRLDYEDSAHTAKNYSVVVTATPTDGSSAVISLFVLSLNNVDDNPTAWSSTPITGIAVDEKIGITKMVTLGVASAIATFKALDADGQFVNYALDGTDKWMFSIDGNGVLYRKYDADYETNNRQFSVTIWTWGSPGNGATTWGAGISQLFVLTVADVNEAPVFKWQEQPFWGQDSTGVSNLGWSNASSAIFVNALENNLVGADVAKFLAVDNDAGARVNYSLSGTDANYFTIDSNGRLYLQSSLDYEDSVHTAKNYSVIVQAISTDGGPMVSNLVVVNLQDSVTEFKWGTTTKLLTEVSEASALAGLTVADFNLTGTTITEGVNAGYLLDNRLADNVLFTIDAKTGILRLAYNRDYEGDNTWRPNHQFTAVVTAWHSGDANISQVFILTVGNVNDNPTLFQDQGQPLWGYDANGVSNRGYAKAGAAVVVNISENNAVGMQVAKFKAVDGDVGALVNYSLSGTDANYFSIDSNGRLYLQSSLDYESTSRVGKTYSVVVQAASNDGSPSINNVFVVSVQNNNNEFGWTAAPSAISFAYGTDIAAISLADFNIGAVDGSASFSEGGPNSAYWLTGADATLFNIDAKTGILKLAQPRDYGLDDTWRPTHNFSVVVNAWHAGAAANISQMFVLSVKTDAVWAARTPSGFISENNTANLLVAQFSAFDNAANLQMTYSLSGTDANYFSLDKVSGNLILKSSLDYDDTTHPAKYYSVIVKASSVGGISIVDSFVLSVGNLNDNPVIFTSATGAVSLRLSENNVAGIQVADFAATDRDAGAVISQYKIIGDDSNYFTITNNGALILKSALDSENPNHRAQYYSVVVQAISSDGSMASNIFVLSLDNVNDNPLRFVSATAATVVNVDENNAAGLQVGNFAAQDADVGATVSGYSLTGADSNYFSIINNGLLILKSSLDAEDANHSQTFYSIGVIATATDGSAVSSSFILSLGNVNDNGVTFVSATAPVSIFVSENNAINAEVANFGASDGDVGETIINYALFGADKNFFDIDNAGRIRLRYSLDYEDTKHTRYYSVGVLAVSSDGNSALNSFVFSVADVNEPVQWSNANSHPATGSVAETYGKVAYVSPGQSYPADLVVPASSFDYSQGKTLDTAAEPVHYVGSLIRLPFSLVIRGTADKQARVVLYNDDATYTQRGGASDGAQATGSAAYSYTLAAGSVIAGYGIFDRGAGGYLKADNMNGLTIPANTRILDINEQGDYFLVNITGAQNFFFTAADPDGTPVSYSLMGVEASNFSIVSDFNNIRGVGRLFYNGVLDYDGTSITHTVTVVASSGGHSTSQLFVLSVTNVNDEQTYWVLHPSRAIIVETSATAGLSIAHFQANDYDRPPPGDNATQITYGLSGADANLFSINSSGDLSLRTTLPSPVVKSLYTVIVLAGGVYGGAPIGYWGQQSLRSEIFVLSVQNINDQATSWVQRPASAIISENNGAGITVANFVVTDADGAGVSYWLTGVDNNLFSMSTSGRLHVVSALDYEATYNGHNGRVFSVTVNAIGVDGGAGVGAGAVAITQLFVLTVSNVDDNATVWSSTPATGIAIDEKSGVAGAPALATVVSIADFGAMDADGQIVNYSISNTSDSWAFSINSSGVLFRKNDFDFESIALGQYFGPRQKFSVTVNAWSTPGNGITTNGAAISQLFVLTINDVNEPTNFSSTPSTGIAVSENNVVGLTVGSFRAFDGDGVAVTYSLGGTDATYFSIDTNGNLKLRSVLDFEDSAHTAKNYSVVVQATSTDGGATISSAFVLSLGNVAGASHADHTAYIDGTTATHAVNVGGIIGHDDAGNIDYANVQFHGVNYTDKVITHNVAPDGLQSTTVDYVVRGISDLESLRISFNGFTDTDGSQRNHWFFVQDDATDHSGHIVFDADGQNVNLHALNDGGGLATSDQINLLAGSNYGIDGDFAKPTDLNLNLASDPLHQNIAGALTFDQFLALLGGSQHISFV